MKKILIVIFCLAFISQSFAQNKDFTKAIFPDNTKELKSALSNIKKGNKAFNKNLDYREAVKFYLRANEFNPKNAQLNYKIFLCYYNLLMPGAKMFGKKGNDETLLKSLGKKNGITLGEIENNTEIILSSIIRLKKK